MFARILVPIDPSELCDGALEYARRFAAAFSSSVRVLRVDEPPPVGGAIPCDAHTASTIVRCANASGVDLIIMGTHGRSGLAHLLRGSVAEKVVRTARCPVLIVRQSASGLAEAELLDTVPDLVPVDAK